MNISPAVVQAVRETRNELAPLLSQLDFRVLSKYNTGYLRYRQDPATFFIDLEIDRFHHTVNFINTHFPKSTRILDIGLFIPVIPIALIKLGYHVDAIEKLAIYEKALDPILDFVGQKYNLTVYNTDIINDDKETLHLEHHYDVVLLMAILEHLNGSPRKLLEKCRFFLKPTGSLFVEVPNVASIAKRISFLLKGNPPFPPYSDYFSSAYPFEGHNREYNFNDLRYALANTGFEIRALEYLNLKIAPDAKLTSRLLRMLSIVGRPSWRDVIWTVSQIKETTGQ